MAGVARVGAKRWPRPDTIRAAQEALERGDTLALQSRRLRYVAEFYGLSLPPTEDGVSPRTRAARVLWARRRERFGDSGLSERGLHAMKLNLVAAAVAKRRVQASLKTWRAGMKTSMCKRGHKWTPTNTRINAKGRSCRTCERITRAERKRKRDEWKKRRDALVEARQHMLEAGIKANQQPDSKYWRDRYVAARDRWQRLKSAAA